MDSPAIIRPKKMIFSQSILEMNNMILVLVLLPLLLNDHLRVESAITHPLTADTIRTRRSTIYYRNDPMAILKEVIERNGGADRVNTDVNAAFNVIISPEIQNDPVLRSSVKFNPNGQVCTPDLCKALRNDYVAIGACTELFCQCGSGMAFLRTCSPGTVFDATIQVCNWRNMVPYC